jgi:alpha-glucosidase
MQYGTLTPFCRNHSAIGNVDQYAWSWGTVILDLVRASIKLRYRLLPYIYAAFLSASQTGAPVQRPLVFDYQYDASVRDIDDEYLFGPDLLIAPVFEPGMTARQVYLPAGTWYDWHSDTAFQGNGYLVVETPMDRIPIYARGGSVIPMWPEAPASTDGYFPRAIELHLFVPESDGSYDSSLAEDDGLTYAAVAGARYRTTFRLSRTRSRLTLRAETDGAGFPGFARREFLLFLHGSEVESLSLDGERLSRTDDHFRLPNTGHGFVVELEV